MNNIILKTKVKVTSSQVDKNKIRVEKKKKNGEPNNMCIVRCFMDEQYRIHSDSDMVGRCACVLFKLFFLLFIFCYLDFLFLDTVNCIY